MACPRPSSLPGRCNIMKSWEHGCFTKIHFFGTPSVLWVATAGTRSSSPQSTAIRQNLHEGMGPNTIWFTHNFFFYEMLPLLYYCADRICSQLNCCRLLQRDDPCLDGNHQVIAGQPERSFNHHLSVGTGAPICDR